MAGKRGMVRPSGSLRAARIVSTVQETKGEKGLVKIYRDMLKKDPAKFAFQLRAMEKDHASLRDKVHSRNMEENSDESIETCIRIAEETLQRLGDK